MRVFFAVDLDEEVRRSAARAIDPSLGLRWAPPEKFHVTVKFLGSCEEARIPEVLSAARKVIQGTPPFEVRVWGAGFFPSVRAPRVFWLGMEDPRAALAGLAAGLNGALAPLGFEKESKPFHPHLTLARVKAPLRDRDAAVRWQERWRETDFGVSRIREVTLYQSKTHPEGAEYLVIEKVGL